MTDTPIDVAFPDAPDLQVRIATGACKVRLAPGEDAAWIGGTYRDPSGLRPTKVVTEGGTTTITPDRPNLGWELVSKVPEYDLRLGTAKPYALSLELGATDTDIELGGLPLRRVEIRLGAGRLVLRFSTPNPQPMSLFSLSMGAGSAEASGLAAADIAELSVDGGAASVKLRYDGVLRRSGHAKVSTGMSSVELAIPASTAAKITSESMMGAVQAAAGIEQAEGAYWTRAGREGREPLLTVETNVTLGSLQLRTIPDGAPSPT